MKAQHCLKALTCIFLATVAYGSAGEPVHVLIANDDGIDAPGIEAIQSATGGAQVEAAGQQAELDIPVAIQAIPQV